MKKYSYYLMFISFIVQCEEQLSPDCVPATEYVMQFLVKSSTLFRGSKTWIDDLKNKNSRVDTVYAKTWNHEYDGNAALILHNFPDEFKSRESMATALFSVRRNENDIITIESSIKDIEIYKAETEEIAEQMHDETIILNGKTHQYQDNNTTCSVQYSMDYDNKSRSSRLIACHSCKTTVDLKSLLEKMRRSKKHNKIS